jgi:protein gp37
MVAASLPAPDPDFNITFTTFTPGKQTKKNNSNNNNNMKNTSIQWCHSTINPVMGCDGCELWPGSDKVVGALADFILASCNSAPSAQPLHALRTTVESVVHRRPTSAIYEDRGNIASELAGTLALGKPIRDGLVDVVRKNCKCYAGLLGTMRAWHKGHASQFERPKLFPGRMAEAAQWGAPTPPERAAKPWLLKAPRMIFVSDMGDALSNDVESEGLKLTSKALKARLKAEIIDVAASEAGRSHLWLWLTKRPARMAEFGHWLLGQGASWPGNLVAMTTVTSPSTAGRVDDLRKVPSRLKGLSCEPLFAPLNLNLTDINWLIVGGGSDVLADPFHVEWALDLRDQCRRTETAFFLKQLGRIPKFQGNAVKLKDGHGGDWNEWPASWQTREIPKQFLSGI